MKQVTKSTKSASINLVKREWHLINMKDSTLGRVANKIAVYLQGKHKSTYAPYIDNGDFVVVINAKKVNISGKKSEQKTYSYYSGYPGGLKKVPFKTLLQKKPSEIVHHAVAGMLPKNKLRDQRLARLFIYPEETHPYGDKITNEYGKKN